MNQITTDKPLCSIIMPCYKAQDYIARSIISIQNQSYPHWELIIIDDASGDGTVKYVENNFVKLDKRIKIIPLDNNSGAAVARNTGIQEASGRFITFLDCDDTWEVEKLEKQINFMMIKGYQLSYTAYLKKDMEGNIIGSVSAPEKVCYKQLLKTNVIGCSTAMYDTQKLGKIYMPLIRKRQDFGLWLRILKKIDYAYGMGESLVNYTIRDGSISSNKKSAAQYTWKLYREVEKLPLPSAVYYFSHYAVKGLLRTKLPKIASLLRI